MDLYTDEFFMKEALKEAIKAFDKEEIPIGAVIVSNNKIIARAHNLTESLNDVTAHAEMQAITAAENYLGGKYLNDCKIYITLEPCAMCAGALYWSQMGEVIYGADDLKKGYRMINKKLLHPKTKLRSGIMQAECGELLSKFFVMKRKQ